MPLTIDRLLRTPVTITRVTMTGPDDDFGDPTEATTTTTTSGYAWQTSRNEETISSDLQEQEWRLALPRTLAGGIDGGDRVTVEGIDFEVVGPPWPARNPRTQQIEHLEVTLRKAST